MREAFFLLVSGIVGGIIFSGSVWTWYEIDRIQKLMLCVVHGWLLIAAWSDLKSRKVSNKWCLIGAGAALGLLLARLTVTDHRWLTVFDRLTGAVLVSSILFAGALLRRGGIGMGDVKVFFVLGLFLGADTAFAILVTTLIIALAAGAVRIVCGKLRGKDRLPLCPYAYVALIVAVLGGW